MHSSELAARFYTTRSTTVPCCPQNVAERSIGSSSTWTLTDVTLVGSDTRAALCQFLTDAHPDRTG